MQAYRSDGSTSAFTQVAGCVPFPDSSESEHTQYHKFKRSACHPKSVLQPLRISESFICFVCPNSYHANTFLPDHPLKRCAWLLLICILPFLSTYENVAPTNATEGMFECTGLPAIGLSNWTACKCHCKGAAFAPSSLQLNMWQDSNSCLSN